MAETSIEWADYTFNPWVGCQKVAPECDHCYAEGWAKRSGMVKWGPGEERRRTSVHNWNQPLKWNAEAATMPFRPRVFCASLADVFDNQVPPEWRLDLFSLIAKTPHLDWLLLTKRIGNVMPMCSGDSLMFDLICERIWLGITTGNQESATRDIPKLLNVPAHKRFLSCEPMLGRVDLCETFGMWWNQTMGVFEGHGQYINRSRFGGGPAIHWVITGGESGPRARPAHPDWFRSLRDQCEAASVPFLFKQWGDWAPCEDFPRHAAGDERKHVFPGGQHVVRVGKKSAGRVLDGRKWDGFPA